MANILLMELVNTFKQKQYVKQLWPIWQEKIYHDHTLLSYFMAICHTEQTYRQVSTVRRTLVGNKIFDHSEVVGALPVRDAPITSTFSD